VRVVFYTHTAYLESALSFVRTLSQRVELHVLLEVSPRAWQLAAFDLQRKELPSGLVPADALLAASFPSEPRRWWNQAASFNVVVHNSRRFYAPGSWRASHTALRFVRHLAPDVIHFDSAPLRLGLLVSEWPSASAVVLSEHDPEPHAGEGDWRLRLARWLAYRRVDRFILHSAANRHAFEQRYGVRQEYVSVVRLGAGELMRTWIDRPVQTHERMVLFFGRLSPYKGLEVLYAAARRVAERLPNVRFVVAGQPVQGYTPPQAPELANGATLEVVYEHIANERLVELCQRASVVVCPYIEATQSGVVLTAYGLAKPVIASCVGGLAEYVTDGESGVLVPPGDPEALAQAMLRVLEDAVFRQHLEEGVKRLTENELNWERVGQETVAVYEAARSTSQRRA
jgi:glycosyltransferase involved in cell wall biosynthesis